MLVSLEMKKWRKHLDRTITFTAGLNAIRGANECGKSTMLYAIAYALWGAKVLPLPLAQMVTWGFPEKDAKVGLVLNAGGEMYNFTRSSAGAECNHSGGVVTGQNEVSKFATELLGVAPDLAAKLMFSSQGDLRGALNSGPTAISSYIEDMSGMDLFDRLMDLISEKLVTGPTTRMDNEVADLESKLEKGGPVAPDLTGLNLDIDNLTVDYEYSRSKSEAILAEAAKANDAYVQGKTTEALRESTTRNLTRAESLKAAAVEQRRIDTDLAAAEVDEPRIEYLRGMIADARAMQARKGAYAAFQALPTLDSEWEGNEASLKAYIASTEARIAGITKQIAGIESDISVAKAKLTTSSVCGFCDQDFSKFPAVAAKNEAINDSVSKWSRMLDPLVNERRDVMVELQDLKDVLNSSGTFNVFLRTYGNYVSADDNFVPPRITWLGDAGSDDSNPAEMNAEMLKLKKAVEVKVAAKVRIDQAERTLADHDITIAELRASIPELVDLDALYKVKFSADTAVSDNTAEYQKLQGDIKALESNKARIIAEYETAKREFAGVEIDLKSKVSERDTLNFNNTLVKKVKSARPKVAAKLWAIVLTSVSSMFSNMRGEQSIVTKGTKGFLVNDHPCEGLSGSALDLLGFAIRVSMLKTFIPDCSFLILDEATSACDDNRTASLLGFIASAGFQQTLLVTHEEAAESVADNVVML